MKKIFTASIFFLWFFWCFSSSSLTFHVTMQRICQRILKAVWKWFETSRLYFLVSCGAGAVKTWRPAVGSSLEKIPRAKKAYSPLAYNICPHTWIPITILFVERHTRPRWGYSTNFRERGGLGLIRVSVGIAWPEFFQRYAAFSKSTLNHSHKLFPHRRICSDSLPWKETCE